MTRVLSIDFETRSTVDLTKAGVYPYAMHRHTDVWCMAWAFDGEEPEIWTPWQIVTTDVHSVKRGKPVTTQVREIWPRVAPQLPQRVIDHIAAGGELRAWNAQFERLIWRHVMVPSYGAPAVRPEQWVCTMAEASAMALPRSLGQAAKAMGIEQQKDDAGYRVMMQMSRPRSMDERDEPIWWEDAEKFRTLCDYCAQDVRTEMRAAKALRRLVPREVEVYQLDQRMNDRGITIDVALVRAAQAIADEGVARANELIDTLTGGEVSAISNSNRLTAWLRSRGVETEGVSKPAVREMLEREIPADVREALVLRANAGRSSLAKLRSMLEVVCTDGRARGLLLYHGAGTGRWSGKLLQPQNFPRGEVEDVEAFIEQVLAGDYDGIDLIAHPIVVVCSMLRSMLTAERGSELIAGDYSAIEARVVNWLAGQEDMLAHFRAYDAGDKSRDPYIQNAMKLYQLEYHEVKKFPHRQTGKFQELGCGFGMGAAKAVSAAKTVYGLDITPEQAVEIVNGYRETHAKVKASWKESNSAAIEAVRTPGVPVPFCGGKLKFVRIQNYLYLILPSGRPLAYPAPRIDERPAPWCDVCGKRASEHNDETGHEFDPAYTECVTFSGVDQYTRQWGRQALYGGLIMENATQAVARDIMAEGKLRLEAAGYIPLLSVHDEVVCEVPIGFGSIEEFDRLLSEVPAWATGCPVATESWRGHRYRK